MRKLLLLLSIGTGLLCAQEVTLLERPPVGKTLWRASVTALTVANLADIHSSWGKHELNATLSGPTGNFGKEGALIKLTLQGGLLGAEYLLSRGHPSRRLYRVLSVINFGAAASIGGVAAHNYTVPRQR